MIFPVSQTVVLSPFMTCQVCMYSCAVGGLGGTRLDKTILFLEEFEHSPSFLARGCELLPERLRAAAGTQIQRHRPSNVGWLSKKKPSSMYCIHSCSTNILLEQEQLHGKVSKLRLRLGIEAQPYESPLTE